MDGSRLSRFPQLSWLRVPVSCDGATPNPLEVHTNGACHFIALIHRGDHEVRWVTRGRETLWQEETGSVHFFPADGAHHTFIATMSADFRAHVVLLPTGHLSQMLDSEGLDGTRGLERILTPDDAILRASIARLLSHDRSDGGFDAAHDEAARRLVLRLAQLSGGGEPDWYDDASVFDRRSLDDLVGFLDSRLAIPPTVTEASALTGLSPSHFARKFRQSTGLSLERFVNRRRIAAAMPLLRSGDAPITAIAERLGFASQSHFTRVFSGMTGMTPSRFRRQFRRGGR